ncbi:MAG: hypothetical protein ABSH22_12760 [Tepidisphaeraceae bacterium]
MSSISLNTGTQSLYSLLGNTNASTQTQNPLLEALANTDASESGSQSPLVTLGAGQSSNSDGILFQKLQQAVNTALTSIQNGSTADPNQVVENAIASVLNPGGSSSSDADGDNDSSASGTSSASGQSASAQAFLQALSSNGVDPQQFQSNFLSAISQAQQSGQIDPGSVFSGFPTGLAVDTVG